MLFLKKYVLLRYQKLLGMPVGSDQARFRVNCFIPWNKTIYSERQRQKMKLQVFKDFDKCVFYVLFISI